MKFFIENQKVEKEVEWVKKQVRLHMNGATTEQMEERGIHYRLNYGVGIPHLKQLAKRIPVSYELAERLWFMEVRETMILAALIVPHTEMTLERCIEWSSKITNIDLVERSAMFLWSKLDIAPLAVENWLQQESDMHKALAFYTLGHLVHTKPNLVTYSIQDVINVLPVEKEDIMVLKAGAFLIRRLVRDGNSGEGLCNLFMI